MKKRKTRKKTKVVKKFAKTTTVKPKKTNTKILKTDVHLSKTIPVKHIRLPELGTSFAKSNLKSGTAVAVAPLAPAYGNKSYFGIYIGKVATAPDTSYEADSKLLIVKNGPYTPAILIPEINEIVYGYDCYWTVITGKKHLTLVNINGDLPWYMKSFKTHRKTKRSKKIALS